MAGYGVALVSLMLLSSSSAGGLGQQTRVIDLPDRAGTPAHAVRVQFWAAEGAGPHPLVVYEPGWNGSAGENGRLLGALARAGFDVAAFDLDTAQPAGFATEAARLTAAMDLSTEPATEQTVADADWRVALLAGDLVAGLGRLPEAASAPAVGVVGYALGGAVAAEACREEPGLAACLNLNGWLFGAAADEAGVQPYMQLSGGADAEEPDAARTLDERDRVRLRARMAEVGGAMGQIDGLRREDGAAAWGRHAAVRSLTLAFFDTYLRGHVSPLLTTDQPLQGVTLVRRDGLKSAGP